MVKRFPFALGWRPIGSAKRHWQLQVCVDVAEAARLAAGLARLDGGRPVAGLRHGDRAGGRRLGQARAPGPGRGGVWSRPDVR